MAGALAAGSLGAQQKPDDARSWHLGGLRQGFCIELLIEAARASRHLAEGFRPLAAGQTPDLHPALRATIASQTEYRDWAPARLCLYFADSLDADGVRLVDRSGRKPLMMAFWTIAAADSASRPVEISLQLLASSSRVGAAARGTGLDFDEAKALAGVPPVDEEGRSSLESRYQLRVGKTQVTWDGRQTGDSVRVQQSLVDQWLSEGRGGVWTARFSVTPRWSRGMAGALKVEGKDDFAKALKASPIRFVGPIYLGGEAELRYSR